MKNKGKRMQFLMEIIIKYWYLMEKMDRSILMHNMEQQMLL